MPQKLPIVSGYQLLQQIGGGGFATVYRAMHTKTSEIAACKVIRITEKTTDKERKVIDKEMRVHTALKHPNVLEFLNAMVVEMKHRLTYVPGIYMLMEYAGGGDLFDKIAVNEGLPEDVAQIYFNQLVDGMRYIHSQGVCHRDLKPENLLLDAAGVLKITDFGLAAVFRLKDTGKTRSLTERCGSLPYVAPELNSDKPYDAEPIDVWGIGVILYTLLVANTPWDEPTSKSPEYCRYVQGEIFDEEPWNRISPDALSLIQGMLTVYPSERMTMNDIVVHPWVMRSSQLATRGDPIELAERLTQGIRNNGDLNIAAPNFSFGADDPMDLDDNDVVMASVRQSPGMTQFTKTLMFFSQTQKGVRYTPVLTKFYASLAPPELLPLVQQFVETKVFETRHAPLTETELNTELRRLRVGGKDHRKQVLKGWVEIEPFNYRGVEGSFVVMRRDQGNPLSWKMLWKDVIESELVGQHVYRK